MFLDKVTVVFIEPCTTAGDKLKFTAKFSRDIAEVLPYINAHMKTARYNHKAQNLTYNEGIKIITMFNDSLVVAKILNESEAFEMSDKIKDLVNEIYEKKDSLEPLYETRKTPSAMEIYKNLPKTNCGKCGEVSCLSFAAKLVLGHYEIRDCRILRLDSYKEKLVKMKEILNC